MWKEKMSLLQSWPAQTWILVKYESGKLPFELPSSAIQVVFAEKPAFSSWHPHVTNKHSELQKLNASKGSLSVASRKTHKFENYSHDNFPIFQASLSRLKEVTKKDNVCLRVAVSQNIIWYYDNTGCKGKLQQWLCYICHVQEICFYKYCMGEIQACPAESLNMKRTLFTIWELVIVVTLWTWKDSNYSPICKRSFPSSPVRIGHLNIRNEWPVPLFVYLFIYLVFSFLVMSLTTSPTSFCY